MARARELSLDCDQPLRLAAARAVTVRTQEVVEHAGSGVLDLDEPERVHDMRVATRRLRAALEVFEPCFPAEAHRRGLKRVKALADALGERRDRDVQIEFLEGFAEEAPEEDRAALAALIEELREERHSANEVLERFVSEERLEGLHRCVSELTTVASR